MYTLYTMSLSTGIVQHPEGTASGKHQTPFIIGAFGRQICGVMMKAYPVGHGIREPEAS